MIPSMLRENAALRPTARTLWEIQEKSNHVPVEVATNLFRDVLHRAEESLGKGTVRRAAVQDAASLGSYQRACRELFWGCIGGMPERFPHDEQTVRVTHHDGFSIERLTFASRPGNRVTANVYVPEGRIGPGPAVLLVVGHTDEGKADAEYQCVAQTMVQAGFVVLVTDPLGEGERFEQYQPDMAYQPIQGCSGEHDLLDWKAKLVGQSLARYFIQDALAALDCLAARPDVDAARIALSGHSGGGTQTVMLMLAAGDRFAAAAPCAYVTDHQAMMDCGVDPDNEMIWPGSLAIGLDYVDMLAGMCPKPILVLTLRHDFFPREGVGRTLSKARTLWQQSGSTTLPEAVTAESGHAYTPELAKAAARFFAKHLMAQEVSLDDFVFRPLPVEELRCTPAGQVITAFPGMQTVHDTLCSRLDTLLSRHGTIEQARSWLNATCLRAADAAAAPEPRVYDEGVCGHVIYRCAAWKSDGFNWNAGVLLRDMRRAHDVLPTVIAVWPEGTQRIAEHSYWLHTMLRRGYQVLVMDVSCAGALLPAKVSGSNYYIGWGTMYKLNAYLLQLGDSLCALRTRQVAAALRMLSSWNSFGANAGPVQLYGQGEFSRYALLAALSTHTPVYTDNRYQPYADIVRERWHDQTNTHEWIIPGILEHTDLPQIVRYLDEQGLLLPDPAN